MFEGVLDIAVFDDGVMVELPDGGSIVIHAGQSNLFGNIERAIKLVWEAGCGGTSEGLTPVLRPKGVIVVLPDGGTLVLQIDQHDLFVQMEKVLRRVFEAGQQQNTAV